MSREADNIRKYQKPPQQETGIIHFLETQKDDRSPINLT